MRHLLAARGIGSISIKKEAKRTAKEIYKEISRLSGVQFISVVPALDEKEIYGYVKLRSCKSKTRGSPLQLLLYKH